MRSEESLYIAFIRNGKRHKVIHSSRTAHRFVNPIRRRRITKPSINIKGDHVIALVTSNRMSYKDLFDVILSDYLCLNRRKKLKADRFVIIFDNHNRIEQEAYQQ